MSHPRRSSRSRSSSEAASMRLRPSPSRRKRAAVQRRASATRHGPERPPDSRWWPHRSSPAGARLTSHQWEHPPCEFVRSPGLHAPGPRLRLTAMALRLTNLVEAPVPQVAPPPRRRGSACPSPPASVSPWLRFQRTGGGSGGRPGFLPPVVALQPRPTRTSQGFLPSPGWGPAWTAPVPDSYADLRSSTSARRAVGVPTPTPPPRGVAGEGVEPGLSTPCGATGQQEGW